MQSLVSNVDQDFIFSKEPATKHVLLQLQFKTKQLEHVEAVLKTVKPVLELLNFASHASTENISLTTTVYNPARPGILKILEPVPASNP